MKIKYDTWSGTYTVYRNGRPVELRRSPTRKMKEIMRKKPKLERQYLVWEE